MSCFPGGRQDRFLKFLVAKGDVLWILSFWLSSSWRRSSLSSSVSRCSWAGGSRSRTSRARSSPSPRRRSGWSPCCSQPASSVSSASSSPWITRSSRSGARKGRTAGRRQRLAGRATSTLSLESDKAHKKLYPFSGLFFIFSFFKGGI